MSKKDLKRARDGTGLASAATSERQIRIIFVRHGESVWNYVFNRGFGPSFLVRLLRVTLYELCVPPPPVLALRTTALTAGCASQLPTSVG